MAGGYIIALIMLSVVGICRSFISKSQTSIVPYHRSALARRVAVVSFTSTSTSSLAASENLPPCIVVKRTRQSRSFREGNPLVFPGAISFTYENKENDDEDSDISKELELGSLVGIEVRPDKEKEKGGRDKKKENSYPHYSTPPKDPLYSAQTIGWGVYNPHSLYRVRILCHATTNPQLMKKVKQCSDTGGGETEQMACILEEKMEAAFLTRLALSLPSEKTDTYRLVNGEGDGLSGLAIDVLGGRVAVVMSSAGWCEIHKDTIISTLTTVLSRHPTYKSNGDNDNAPSTALDIIWKTTPERLKQDGYKMESNSDEGEQIEKETRGENEDQVIISTESGIKYKTVPYEKGQKTGVYCDQRENRWNLAQFCQEKQVLDLCCYHGGFSLNAMVHGNAAHCTGVDSSQDAIDICHINAELNRGDNDNGDDNYQFVRDDIAAFMKKKIEDGSYYDVIALDPPKLAPSLPQLDRASRKYHALNRDAIKLISPEKGGLLMTCTCSAAMTQKDGGQYFLNMVQQAAVSAGRSVTLLRVSGAASCHTQNPAGYPAGAYLTAALFFVSPV